MDASHALLEFALHRRAAGRDEHADGHTVRALGSALPLELLPLVEALNVVLQRDAAR